MSCLLWHTTPSRSEKSPEKSYTHNIYVHFVHTDDPIEIKTLLNINETLSRHRGYSRTITLHTHPSLYGHIRRRVGKKATVLVLTRGSEEGQSAMKLFSAEEVMRLLPVLSPYNGVQ